MEQNPPPEPTLLEYANFYGLATDFSAVHPHECINHTIKAAYDHNLDQNPETFSSTFDTQLAAAQSSVENSIRKEKLSVSKDDAHYLSTVIKNVRSTSLCKTGTSASTGNNNWEKSHAKSQCCNRRGIQKLAVPLLRSGAGDNDDGFLDVKPSKKPSASMKCEDMVDLRHFNENEGELQQGEDLGFLDDLFREAGDIARKIPKEKLECSRDALLLLQKVKQIENLSAKDVEGYFDSVFERLCQRAKSYQTSPLILSPKDFDDVSYNTPRTYTTSHMLPSPVSSDAQFRCAAGPSPIPRPKLGESRTHQEQASSSPLREGLQIVKKKLIQRAGFDHREPVPVFDQQEDSDVGGQKGKPVYPDEVIVISSSPPPEAQGDDTRDCHVPETEGQPKCRNEGGSAERPEKERASSRSLVDPISRISGAENTVHNDSAAQSTGDLGGNTDILEGDTNTQTQTQESAPKSSTSTRISERALQPKKRKRNKANPTIPKTKKRRPNPQPKPTTTPPKSAVASQSATCKPLGSLSRFMETRGKAIPNPEPKPQGSLAPCTVNPESESSPNDAVDSKDAEMETGHENADIDEDADTDTCSYAYAALAPQSQNKNTPTLLYLSTTLLRTHLQLIRILEGMPNPPTLIYRDYNNNNKPSPSPSPFPLKLYPHLPQNRTPKQKKKTHHSPPEADIIISPSTGILLAPSQAMTQTYLPGHRPDCPKISNIKEINSPLRERIFRLSSRYERLYVIICHPVDIRAMSGTSASTRGSAEDRRRTQQRKLSPTADKMTLSSLTALSAFCASLSAGVRVRGRERCFGSATATATATATVTPILLPAKPEIAINWILALADKHTPKLSNNPDDDETAVRQKILAHHHHQGDETRWEGFLREAGLNPFAARAVLGVLSGYTHHQGSTHNSSSGESDVYGYAPALSTFVGMSTEERKRLFRELIGERVLRRVESVIDRDWQCDWALDFDVDGSYE